MGRVGAPYRYRLQLVPRDHLDVDEGGAEAEPAPGWELVSSRTTGEGDALIMFRQLVSTERAS